MSTTRPPQRKAPDLTPGMNPALVAGLLFDQFVEWITDAATRQRILVDNPAKLYGF